MNDLISRQAAIEGLPSAQQGYKWETCFDCPLSHGCPKIKGCTNEQANEYASQIPNDCPLSAQPDTEKICARIKAEAIKRNVEYMKHGDRYMLGFVDGMRLARRIVDGTVDDPVYFTVSGE